MTSGSGGGEGARGRGGGKGGSCAKKINCNKTIHLAILQSCFPSSLFVTSSSYAYAYFNEADSTSVGDPREEKHKVIRLHNHERKPFLFAASMSWLFGVGNKGQGDVPQIQLPQPPPGPGGDGGGDGGKGGKSGGGGLFGKQSEAYRFDSAALERAAQAAKELEKSSK